MSTPTPSTAALADVRRRLLEIATTASTAAEALDAGRVDLFEVEVAPLLARKGAPAADLGDVCELLADGVDPQGAPAPIPGSPGAY
jgi:hypothetical protein